MEKKKPLVSVIVPNYNHAQFLQKRIDSILNQTFQDFELILLDDCSTDNSVEILTRYSKHPKVSHFIVNKENSGGPFKQWKQGVDLVSGTYIWIAESDDYAAKDFLQILLKPLIETNDIGLSYCQSTIINQQGEELYLNTSWTDDLDTQRWLKGYVNDGKEECVKYLAYKNTIPNASAVVFKKELVGRIPADFKMAGDWWFWITILLKTKIAYNARALNYFRSSDASTRNHDDYRKRLTRISEGLQVINLLKNHLPEKVLKERIRFHYQWYMRILPYKKLIRNFWHPCHPFEIKVSSFDMIKFAIFEIFRRMRMTFKEKQQEE